MDLSTLAHRLADSLQGESTALQLVGEWAQKLYQHRDLIQIQIHMILSALFPIYIGAHASLRRPSSAAAPKKLSMDEEDDELEERVVDGLNPSDAIMLPLFAGITLAGFYFVIKWLKDPAILNKILNYYFSGLGVFGVGKLAADFLNVATTFVFPSVWSSKIETYHIDPLLSQQVTEKKAKEQTQRTFTQKTNPFPGILSNITFSAPVTKQLWALRDLLSKHWILRGYFHNAFNFKTHVKVNDVVGLVIGVAAITLYNLNGKAWWLTNLMGFGFCYGTLQIISPTTFWTGSMLMVGLFIYDIVMVFYTPLMITVATTIDAPIKLIFPGAKRGGMLGLGDVVLPGIMMALALRLDIYLHYLRKQSVQSNVSGGQTITRAEYQDATGVWGERFWTQRDPKSEVTVADGARFPKIYFKASLVGYVLAMFAASYVMNVWNHPQPALLYLVPGILTALWGTALVRGEFNLMWDYTEDGSVELDNEPQKVKGTKKVGNNSTSDNSRVGGLGSEDSADTVKPSNRNTAEEKGSTKEERAKHIFLFSLSEPIKGKQ